MNVFSFQVNPAVLAKLNKPSAGIYSEKRFLLKELSLYNAAGVIPTHSGNFGLDARLYGFTDYNETQLGLAYARSLGSKLDLGIQFSYYAVRVAGYGNASAINFGIGTILHLTDKLNAGLYAFNPVGGKFGKQQEEKLAFLYSAGFGYEASENFFVSMEIVKEEDKPVNVNAALQYKFAPQLLVRVGILTATSSMFTGIGYGWKSIRVDATANYHPQLGITPGLLIIFNFNKRKED